LALQSLVRTLREHRSSILSKFVSEVERADLAPAGTPRSLIIDHIPVFLDELAAHLDDAVKGQPAVEVPSPDSPSVQHAAQRWELGYDVGALIREYGLLRQAILAVATEQALVLSTSDFNALSLHLNAANAEAVTRYVAFRDAELNAKNFELAFLAEAGDLLSSSLDFRSTLSRLTTLLVPRLADFCAVHVEGVSAEEMPLSHADPAKLVLLRELYTRFPLPADSAKAHPGVMRTGEPLLVAKIAPGYLEANYQGGQLELLQKLNAHSWLTVPLRLKAGTFGAITVAFSDSPRSYGEHDLIVLGEVARRAAVAIDNARLFQLALEERSRVEAATRAKDEFVAMVSHELRTPLNAMLGWLRLIRGGQLTPEKRAHGFDVIERNAEAQSRLVADLLDISRIITGKIRINPSQVELGNVLDMAIEAVRTAAEAKRIEIALEVEHSATLMRGDGDRLQQVFWNLLANAVKFTPKGGRISVRARRVDSDLEVVVQDNGVGISPAFMPHLFESFRQADAGGTRAPGGLGLGLSIARHIVELHGGTISGASEGVGKGATFRVRLPISPLVSTTVGVSRVPATTELPFDPGPGQAPQPGIRVLVVDDEEDARELVCIVLESAGMEARAAGSMEQALKLLETFTPHVIVSDIGMPGEDGYALIRSVRMLPSAEKKNIPAIALTAFAQNEDRTRALVAGFNAHMGKPVEPQALVKAVAELAVVGSKPADKS
jgi:signal transduction histidine kinase/ActR/RegA family two-component response regulator